jgi:hypothetical protein
VTTAVRKALAIWYDRDDELRFRPRVRRFAPCPSLGLRLRHQNTCHGSGASCGRHLLSCLALYAVGQLNGLFALWAGLLDCAVGFSAPFAGHYLTPTRTAMQRRFLIGWMVAGIADFLVAIFLARMARIADPASMAALNMPPLSVITTFLVPLALIAYFIRGAHLWQQRGRA